MFMKREKACKGCPFRKTSIRGWLGPWKFVEILMQAFSEGGLACHTYYDKKVKNIPQGNPLRDIIWQDSHVCVGSLQSANKSCKRYQDPGLARMAERAGKPDDIMNSFEFREHHEEMNNNYHGMGKKK